MPKKENSSKPDGGPHVPAGKKMTSKPQGDGLDGRAGNLNGKDPAANEETRRDSQPKNWRRKVGSKHADAQAQKREC